MQVPHPQLPEEREGGAAQHALWSTCAGFAGFKGTLHFCNCHSAAASSQSTLAQHTGVACPFHAARPAPAALPKPISMGATPHCPSSHWCQLPLRGNAFFEVQVHQQCPSKRWKVPWPRQLVEPAAAARASPFQAARQKESFGRLATPPFALPWSWPSTKQEQAEQPLSLPSGNQVHCTAPASCSLSRKTPHGSAAGGPPGGGRAPLHFLHSKAGFHPSCHFAWPGPLHPFAPLQGPVATTCCKTTCAKLRALWHCATAKPASPVLHFPFLRLVGWLVGKT